MTVSLRSSPLAFFRHDVVVHREFPYEFAAGDPGTGSGGSSSIAVETSPGTIVPAWVTYGNAPSVASGHFPPPGYGYPAQPSQAALAAAVRWWPQGFHHSSQITWSPNFGVVASNVTGLLPTGEVVPHNFCYPWISNQTLKWTFLGYSSSTSDNRNPYSGNTTYGGTWWRHFGYDLARRKDLVAWELMDGNNYLTIYETSAAIPTIRGTHVFQGTQGDRNLGRLFNVEGGFQRIQIPWLGVWWVVQYSQTSSSNDQIWGFAPTSTPASSGSSTAAGFNVARGSDLNGMPAAVHSRAQSGGGNIHFVVDQMGQRVFAYQADTSQASQNVGGVTKYPLAMWEVNPSSFVWQEISMASPLYVALAAKLNVSPMAYYGGSKFMYFDQRPAASAGWGDDPSPPGNPLPSETQRTGGFYVREIFIPKIAPPRTMTWTQRTWSGLGGGSQDGWSGQKHVEMTFNSADGKIYCFGGDHGGLGDSTLDSGSYTNQVLSFSPESGSDLTLLENACPASLATNHPIRVDENGFQYRASSNDFWMMPGYTMGNWTNQCGWSNRDAWVAAGGSGLFYKWTDAGGWTKVARANVVAKAGFSGRVWVVGEDHCRRWYYDSGADKMIALTVGSGDVPNNDVLTLAVQIMDCTPVGANYEFSKYRADRCWNGFGGNKALLPDGRPATNTTAGAISMWRTDRAAVDPATGYVYVYQPQTGDVFRIYTRSDFWTDEGSPAARVDWVCRAIGTGVGWNLAHFVWAKSALWMFFQSGTGRVRAFSWANGETIVTEHLTPSGAIGTSVCVYSVGGDARICVIGNQSNSWSTFMQSQVLKYYTITLS